VIAICNNEQKIQTYKAELNMLRQNSRHWTDIKILSYLDTYKIAREDDLTTYAAQVLNKPLEYIHRNLERMVEEKKIKRIFHDRLEPKQTYYEGSHLGVGIDHSLWLLSGLDAMGELEKYRQALKTEIRKYEQQL
jgi:hypothetical protein